MYELYQTKRGSRGSAAEVWIDKEKRLVKKYYKPNGITITGGVPLHNTIEKLKQLYEAEVFWTSCYPDFTLEIYEHGSLTTEQGFYTLQEYGGDDLIHQIGETIKRRDIPNFSEQILEMFKQFKEKNMYKLNNALCNMVYDSKSKKVKAIDFKYSKVREERLRELEIYSVTEWISKIDSNLPRLIIGELV